MTSNDRHLRGGLMLGLGAYFLWGVAPAYFKLLSHVSPVEIVTQRVLWSLSLVAALVGWFGRWQHLRAAIVRPRLISVLVLTALLIGANWLIYIWAIVSDHLLQASLGYFLNPLVNVMLGVALLHERLSKPQIVAVCLAAIGVATLAIGAGGEIWISLSLALTFALYGFLRKIAPVDALEGLAVETFLLAPIAAIYVAQLSIRGEAAFASSPATVMLLILSGAVTAMPLLMFTAAAKRLPYSTLGFLQYVAPSIQFLLAVFAYREPLSHAHLLCFGAIWIGLAIFAIDGMHRGRAASRARSFAP